jgi:hypothetical protein
MTELLGDLEACKASYRKFIDRCAKQGSFCLTSNADTSPYALCFAIFGLQLLKDEQALTQHAQRWDEQLREGLAAVREQRQKVTALGQDKAYLQLLTFTLSALWILGTLRAQPLEAEVTAVLPKDLLAELRRAGCFEGRARSGNHAMFMAILLLHARDYLGMNSNAALEQWLQSHLQSMNRFGFWGQADSMSHLQFQNGYHQYEILEFLHANGGHWQVAADNVASLADSEGHFAPYPGGGGCYDYDAVFVITGANAQTVEKHAALLKQTALSIVSEQNADGGFCESHRVRPLSWANLGRTAAHVSRGRGAARVERLRYAVSLLRPKNARIHTHWSKYSRAWGESDLWDSWFRMLTLARISVALDVRRANEWGFIAYPGIGFHPSAADHSSH